MRVLQTCDMGGWQVAYRRLLVSWAGIALRLGGDGCCWCLPVCLLKKMGCLPGCLLEEVRAARHVACCQSKVAGSTTVVHQLGVGSAGGLLWVR